MASKTAVDAADVAKDLEDGAEAAQAVATTWDSVVAEAEHVGHVIREYTGEVPASVKALVAKLFRTSAKEKIAIPTGTTFADAKSLLMAAGKSLDPPATVRVTQADGDQADTHVLVSAGPRVGRAPGSTDEAATADAPAAGSAS